MFNYVTNHVKYKIITQPLKHHQQQKYILISDDNNFDLIVNINIYKALTISVYARRNVPEDKGAFMPKKYHSCLNV